MRGSMEGVNDAYSILGLLLSGIIVGGGLGLLIDVLAGIHYLFLPVGIVVGVGLGVYVVVIRYGSGSSGKPSR